MRLVMYTGKLYQQKSRKALRISDEIFGSRPRWCTEMKVAANVVKFTYTFYCILFADKQYAVRSAYLATPTFLLRIRITCIHRVPKNQAPKL